MPRNSEKSGLLALLLPLLAGCLCVMLSVVLVSSLHYRPQLFWHLHAAAWSAVVLLLAALPRYLLAFAPMLLMWAFWFSLQGEIAAWWRLPSNSTALGYSEVAYDASIGAMFALSLLLHSARFRRRRFVLLAALVYAVLLCAVPKPPVANEKFVVAQAAAFTLLYISGNAMIEMYALQRKRTRRHQRHTPSFIPSIGKLLYSSWALWIARPLWLGIATLLHVLVTLCLIFYHEQEFWEFCANETRSTAEKIEHALNPEDPSESEDDRPKGE